MIYRVCITYKSQENLTEVQVWGEHHPLTGWEQWLEDHDMQTDGQGFNVCVEMEVDDV